MFAWFGGLCCWAGLCGFGVAWVDLRFWVIVLDDCVVLLACWRE